jgi:hypothetical protein
MPDLDNNSMALLQTIVTAHNSTEVSTAVLRQSTINSHAYVAIDLTCFKLS